MSLWSAMLSSSLILSDVQSVRRPDTIVPEIILVSLIVLWGCPGPSLTFHDDTVRLPE